jgi:hypothetical protein
MAEKPQKQFPTNAGVVRRLYNLGKRSTRVLRSDTPPEDSDEFLLTNGMAALQFLKSLGDDTINAKEIGIDKSGRLFRVTQDNCVSLEHEFREQVRAYEYKHERPPARNYLLDAFCTYQQMCIAGQFHTLYRTRTPYLRSLSVLVGKMLEVDFVDDMVPRIVKQCDRFYTYFQDLFHCIKQLQYTPDLVNLAMTEQMWERLIACVNQDNQDDLYVRNRSEVSRLINSLNSGQLGEAKKFIDRIYDEFRPVLTALEPLQTALQRVGDMFEN